MWSFSSQDQETRIKKAASRWARSESGGKNTILIIEDSERKINMDRYFLFRKFLNTLDEQNIQVTDANMRNYADNIEITGVFDGGEVKITISFQEADKDA